MAGRSYKVELVGGPWDGEAGLIWWAERVSEEPPERLLIGMCSGKAPWPCTGQREMCWTVGRGAPHSAWWAPDEDGIPFDAVAYARREVEWDAIEERGRVRYVYGRIKARPRAVSEEVGMPGELVTA